MYINININFVSTHERLKLSAFFFFLLHSFYADAFECNPLRKGDFSDANLVFATAGRGQFVMKSVKYREFFKMYVEKDEGKKGQ